MTRSHKEAQSKVPYFGQGSCDKGRGRGEEEGEWGEEEEGDGDTLAHPHQDASAFILEGNTSSRAGRL